MNRIDTILRHIQEDCQDIQAFTDGLDERSFLENKLVRNAVGMSLINIGELVKSLPMDFRETNPQIPWRRIAGMRRYGGTQIPDFGYGSGMECNPKSDSRNIGFH